MKFDPEIIPGILGITCARNSYYSEMGFPKDLNEIHPNVRRKNRLYSIGLDLYKEKTGRKVSSFGRRKFVYIKERQDAGGLLLDVVDREEFARLTANGLSGDRLSKLHYLMAILSLGWGSFALYWPDGDEIHFWDIQRDEKFQKKILSACENFYLMHLHTKSEPDPLPLGSELCDSCEYWNVCRGELMDGTLTTSPPQKFDLEGPYNEAMKTLNSSKNYAELVSAWKLFNDLIRDKHYGLKKFDHERAKDIVATFRAQKRIKRKQLQNPDL